LSGQKSDPSESLYAELYEESLKSPSVHSFDLSFASGMEEVFHPAASTSFIVEEEDEEEDGQDTDRGDDASKPLPDLPMPVRSEHAHTVIRHALSLEPVAECDEEPTYSFIKVQDSSDEGENMPHVNAAHRVSIGHPGSFRRSLLLKQTEMQGSPLRLSQSSDHATAQTGPSQPKSATKTEKGSGKQADRKGKHARTTSRESNKLVKPHRDSHASNTTYFTSVQRQRAESSPPIPLRIECTPVVPVKQKQQKSRTTWIPRLLLAPDAEEGEKVTPGGVPDSSWSDKDKERAGSRESSESFE